MLLLARNLGYAAFENVALGNKVVAGILVVLFVAYAIWTFTKGLRRSANVIAWSFAVLVWAVGLAQTRGDLRQSPVVPLPVLRAGDGAARGGADASDHVAEAVPDRDRPTLDRGRRGRDPRARRRRAGLRCGDELQRDAKFYATLGRQTRAESIVIELGAGVTGREPLGFDYGPRSFLFGTLSAAEVRALFARYGQPFSSDRASADRRIVDVGGVGVRVAGTRTRAVHRDDGAAPLPAAEGIVAPAVVAGPALRRRRPSIREPVGPRPVRRAGREGCVALDLRWLPSAHAVADPGAGCVRDRGVAPDRRRAGSERTPRRRGLTACAVTPVAVTIGGPRPDGVRVARGRATARAGGTMVGMPGFEPGASASRTLRANQTAPHPVRAVSVARRQPAAGAVPASRPLAARRRMPGVDRLHELGVGVGPLGEEAVGLAVEQQQDLRGRDPALAGLEPEVDARTAMPPMLPICMSRTTRSGSCWATAPRTSWPRRTSTTCLSGPGERRRHLVAHPVGFGGDEDRGHGRATLLGPCDRPRRRIAAEEDLADLGEGVEVVHVVGEVRHVRDRRRCGSAPAPSRCWPRSRSAISLKSARFS